jgi:uncharacterized repeat protein (TIGR01451 family)
MNASNCLRKCRMLHAIFKKLTLIVMTVLFFSATSWAASTGSIISTSVEFSPPPYPSGFGSIEPWNPVWHYKDSTYVIWIDGNYRPWVTQVTNGIKTTVPLDQQADYQVQADGHHRFSLGVDKNGYIHITGDMHHYSNLTTDVITPYPLRYQKQIILYWKSNKPADVSGGFSFAGGNASTAIPGGGWLIGYFFADNNHELYYASQVHAFESGTNNNGQNAVGLYRYNATTQAWTAIGATVPMDPFPPYTSNINPVFFWENAGASGGWFQDFQEAFSFDKNNRLHFSVTANTVSTLPGANRILYAWKKANGTVIPGLPLRGADGQRNVADIVADGGTTDTYDALVGLAVNTDNNPGLSVGGVWYKWTGSAWTTQTALNLPNLPVANKGYRFSDNSLLFNDVIGNKILLAPQFEAQPIGYDFSNYTGFTAINSSSVTDSGTIYGVASNPDGVSETIVKTVVTPAPLPANWSFTDVDKTVTGFAGNSGYLNGKFILSSYGVSIDDNSDSFQYAYENLNGDGTISARVTLPTSNARAGVMIRDTLADNSKNVAMLLSPASGNSQALFSNRATTGGQSSLFFVPGVTSPYYVQLVRKGNVFTGSISKDGVTWKQVSQTTVAMNSNVYVGFADTAYAGRWYSQTATFDNTVVPNGSTGICTRATPNLSFSPTTQTGTAGDTLTYTVNLTNTDSIACSNNSYTLSDVLPTKFTGAFAETAFTVAPGNSVSTTLQVTSATASAANIYAINAIATSNTGLNGNAIASYVVKPTSSCVQKQPTFTITPSTQTITRLIPANYVVSVKNNDSAGCAARLFRYTAMSSSGYVSTFMEPYNVYIDAGKSNPSQLVLTPSTGLKAGTTTVKVTNADGGSGSTRLVYKPKSKN